jgi:hypothetical protein
MISVNNTKFIAVFCLAGPQNFTRLQDGIFQKTELLTAVIYVPVGG